ncbi:unnamed protein product, partial [Brenthis ino]
MSLFPDSKPNNDENCIKMNPDIQKQLNNIVEEITKQVNAISAEYDAVDLRLLEISVDRHFPEDNQKNTVVQITVNDCTNGLNQSNTDDIKYHTYSVIQEDISNTSNKSLNNDNDFENFDSETDNGNDSNSGKIDNGKVISEVSLEENDFDEDDLFIDDINPEYTKKPDTQAADDIVIDEFDIDFDDFNDRETNITSQINVKNDIPVKLNLIDFNNIKQTKFDKEFKNINSISKELNLIDNDDKIFFRAMKKARGDGPFVIYERYVQDSVQYWFF